MTFVRFLHLLAMAFFVGGQLLLVTAIAPVLRGDEERMRALAKRFGMGSGIALVVLIATGAVMASHDHRWGDSTLQAKLGLLVLVFVLTGLHVVSNRTRAISLALVAVSVGIVYLGVRLAYG